MLVESWPLRQRGRRSRSSSRSRPRGEGGHDHFRCWWLVVQRFMRPDCVEVAPPTFDDDLGLTQRVKYFTIEQFISQACVEALDVTILSGAGGLPAWMVGRGTALQSTNPVR